MKDSLCVFLMCSRLLGWIESSSVCAYGGGGSWEAGQFHSNGSSLALIHQTQAHTNALLHIYRHSWGGGGGGGNGGWGLLQACTRLFGMWIYSIILVFEIIHFIVYMKIRIHAWLPWKAKQKEMRSYCSWLSAVLLPPNGHFLELLVTQFRSTVNSCIIAPSAGYGRPLV